METYVLPASLEPITDAFAYIGMACILGAFVLETRDKISSRSLFYLGLMAVGSGILAVRAMHTGEWAFLILEIAWMAAALMALRKVNPTGNDEVNQSDD